MYNVACVQPQPENDEYTAQLEGNNHWLTSSKSKSAGDRDVVSFQPLPCARTDSIVPQFSGYWVLCWLSDVN